MRKFLRVLRILLSFATLATITAAFLGVKQLAVCCRLQFVPAATVVASGEDNLLAWIPLAAILVITVCLGRFYCRALCPIGILQSLVGFCFRGRKGVRRVCTRLPSSPAQKAVRYTLLAAFLGLIVAGYGGLASLLDPYSLYGQALTLFTPGLVLASLATVSAAFGQGRFWCNWICPVGTILNLVARKSLLADKLARRCSGCGKCVLAEQRMRRKRDKKLDELDRKHGIDRRTIMRGAVAAVTAGKLTDGGLAPVSLPGVPERERPVLPPGTGSAAEFSRKCVACGLCMLQCPEKIIRPSMKLEHFGQPELTFTGGHCRQTCTRCTEVCPSGAIMRQTVADRRYLHLGEARWTKALCIREDGVDCSACVRKCPVEAIHLEGGWPVVDKVACIGCGACEHVCPARPLPAIHVVGHAEQRRVVPVAESDLLSEMRHVLDTGAAVVAARGGVIIGSERGHGIKPLLTLYDKDMIRSSIIVDRVIGRAAAAICIAGGAKEVHTRLISEDASTFLRQHGVPFTAAKSVPQIMDRNRIGKCPLELTVEGLDSPSAMLDALRKFIAR